MADRESQRKGWLEHVLGREYQIVPLAGDASFRRYFRVEDSQRHYVLMDAPPPHEDVSLFLAVRSWFVRADIRVSKMFAEDLSQGFLLMEDFGDLTWAGCCETKSDLEPLFKDGLRQLHLLQASAPEMDLPFFDIARMRRECDLYLDWYLPKVAGLEPTKDQRQQFHNALADTVTIIAALPQVPVHLDYHSRNLMLPAGELPLGMIDYQDAVMGPVSYDLASLLYDCYQDYPEPQRRVWSRYFFDHLPHSLAAGFSGFDDWHQKLRMTALQRHIKAIGIFARLAHRDGKKQFLTEIPLTRKHLLEELQVLGMHQDQFPLLYTEPSNS
ncbi:phosphotransferase [Mariprofundus sp. NF]|uniref:aminoglycoside phosphotransferase family protein n=1 Tax=Mariprofundus sp. NF TaxID=2608716 RepID=UPI0015A443EF|nr:phosphotransferase [Mariprofundus sp. NF]NWF37662.1 phosphotransferase [Mariprofundus sp. NF]